MSAERLTDTAVGKTYRENGDVGVSLAGCSSEGVEVGIVVRARLHDRHLIDGEPLSSDHEDRGRAGCWDRERLNRRSGHQSLAIRAPRVL